MGGVLKTYLLLICILAYLSANDAASVDNEVNKEKISVDAEEMETSDREKRWVAGCHPPCNTNSYCSHGHCICNKGCHYVHGICQPDVVHLGTITHNHHHHHHGNIGIIGSPPIHIPSPIRISRPPFRGGGSSSSSSSGSGKRRRKFRRYRRRYRRKRGGSSSK